MVDDRAVVAAAAVMAAYVWWVHARHRGRRESESAAVIESLEAQVHQLKAAELVSQGEAVDSAKRMEHLAASLSRSQHNDRINLECPPCPPDLVPTASWRRCVDACEASRRGNAGRRTKGAMKNRPVQKLLLSAFSDAAAHSADKAAVDALIAARVARELPHLLSELASDPTLVLLLLHTPACTCTRAHVHTCTRAHVHTCTHAHAQVILLLDAPTCGTTAALLAALPGLGAYAGRICIPQVAPRDQQAGLSHHAHST